MNEPGRGQCPDDPNGMNIIKIIDQSNLVLLNVFGERDKMDYEKRELEIEKVLNSFGVERLKVEQRKMLDALLEKKDCMTVLPTGYGKSLPYQMLVPLQRELGLDAGKVIVCSPLIALMQDQSQRLSRIPGLEVVCKGLIFILACD